MRIVYRFEGPPGANGVAPYVSEGRAINAAKMTFRNRCRGPGDLLKVFRKTTDGEVFIGHVEYDPRERVVLWYPSGQETKRTAAMSDGTLKRIRLVYAQAERRQRPEYSPLPKWETLSIEVREAIIHVYRQGRLDALREKKS
jgi:hypothetical protein